MDEDIKYYQLFLDGDQKGFEQLVYKYKDNLIYFLQRYVKSPEQAEDLAQDAFVEILVHKERFQFKYSFKTYLFTIGRNKAVDFIRKNRRQIPIEELSEWQDQGQKLLEQIVRKEERKRVLQAVKQLKEDYQRAIYLIDLEELSYHEAAGVLGKTMPQMKILIHRARKALKKEMEKEGYEYAD